MYVQASRLSNTSRGIQQGNQQALHFKLDSGLHFILEFEVIIKALSDAGINAHAWSRVLKTLNALDDKAIVEKLLKRVELQSDGITLILSLDAIIQNSDTDISTITITKTIPMQMKRRGIEMRMIVSETQPARTDPTLIRTIINAHRWLEELLYGDVENISAIASRESIDRSYVNRVLSLVFLAPAITESILSGTQPADLSLEKLTKRMDLPLDWAKQQQLLGFASRQ